ncbi:hypothetical protein TA3x_005351 [Tundrisphaera sp. TA3]|uniref:hypothetical protein n=1 Tax=Tundrisphaera sp. TA3 TaxID=3435775 RepID=UPI003EB8F86E
MGRERAFFVGLLCGTCATAAVALVARRVEPPAPPAVVAATGVPVLPAMDYAYDIGLFRPDVPVPNFGSIPVPNDGVQPVPEPEGRTFNGQPLYIVPLGAVAAK